MGCPSKHRGGGQGGGNKKAESKAGTGTSKTELEKKASPHRDLGSSQKGADASNQSQSGVKGKETLTQGLPNVVTGDGTGNLKEIGKANIESIDLESGNSEKSKGDASSKLAGNQEPQNPNPNVSKLGKLGSGNPMGSGAPNANKPSFAELFMGDREAGGMESLSFHEEMRKGRVKVTAEDVRAVQNEWEATLIGVVVGGPVSQKFLQAYAAEKWKVAPPTIYLKDNGTVIFKFQYVEDSTWVMSHGPWMIGGSKHLVLKEWESRMQICWEEFEKAPVWVCLPDLDPLYFNRHMLGKIGSAIGRPICIDRITALGEKLSFARLLIEVDPKEAQAREIVIEDVKGKEAKQKVIYEWLPWTCSCCNKFGHVADRCSLKRKMVQKWAPTKGQTVAKQWKGTQQAKGIVGGSNVASTSTGQNTQAQAKVNVSDQNKGKQKEVAAVGKDDQRLTDSEKEKGWETQNKRKPGAQKTIQGAAEAEPEQRNAFETLSPYSGKGDSEGSDSSVFDDPTVEDYQVDVKGRSTLKAQSNG